MSFLLIYKSKRKLIHNIEMAIETAKGLPDGECKIVDADNTTRVVWERVKA